MNCSWMENEHEWAHENETAQFMIVTEQTNCTVFLSSIIQTPTWTLLYKNVNNVLYYYVAIHRVVVFWWSKIRNNKNRLKSVQHFMNFVISCAIHDNFTKVHNP